MGADRFISGWGGFREMFPTASSNLIFAVPEYTHSEEQIRSIIDAGGGRLIGWSTGAHIILKYIDEAANSFEKIALFAPFEHFCDSVDERVVRMMIKKLGRDPHAVLTEFYKNCGCGWFRPPENLDAEKLINGLEFLIKSRAEIPDSGYFGNVSVICAAGDKIVKPSLSKQTAQKLGCKLVTLDSGHYIDDASVRYMAK